MRRLRIVRFTVMLCVGLGLAGALHADPDRPLPLSFSLAPYASFPLGSDSSIFTLGGGAQSDFAYTFPQLPQLTAALTGDYHYLGTLDPALSLSVLGGGLRAGYQFKILPILDIRATAASGWYYGFANTPPAGAAATSGQNPWLSGGLGLGLRISEWFALSAEATYQNYLGLYQGVGVTLNASLSPAGESPFIYDTSVPDGYTALPKQKRGLKLVGLKPERIFPVFKNYYDDHELASVVLHNYSNSPATDVQVTAEFKGYMDGPRNLKAPSTLTAGMSQVLPVNALFNDQILTVSEATKLGLTLTVKYTQDGGTQTEVYSPSVDVLYRDAITWDDDRHVAAFISARDPAAYGLIRGLVSATRDLRNRAVSQNLQTAMVVQEALKQHGMVYSKVPTSPFNTGNQLAVDTVQFPQEALKSRTGDCSDLTVLWCSLLESVGIETAVVTIPGHIYMAFALDLPPEQAVTVLGSRDMFLFKNGKAWVPVETTMITDSFYNAWKEGARESDPASQPDLAFYPIHEAWKAFAPIVVSSDAPVPAVPATATLAAALDNGLRSLVRAELEPRAAALKAEIANAANPAKATNSLALLYARYGQYDQATSILETLIAKQPYGPAYVNLGNIHLIEKEYQQALDRYQSWLAVNPVEPLAIAGQALAYDGLGDRAKAREAFTKLADLDKKLAQKYAYLNSADSDSGGRAAEIGQLDGVLSWKEGTE